MDSPILVASKDYWYYCIYDNYSDIDSTGYEKIDIENEEYWAWKLPDVPLELYWNDKLNAVRFREMKAPLNHPNISEFMRRHAERLKVDIKGEHNPLKIAELIDTYLQNQRKSLWFRIKEFFERF